MIACLLSFGVLSLTVPALAQEDPYPVPEPAVAPADTPVGAYYFPGWNSEDQWYCVKAHPDTRHPLLGYYPEGDPVVADWHIKWALEHGVSFFAYDYYIHGGAEMLEHALEGLLQARYLDRFRFCLNWCNHAPPAEMTADELRLFADVVIDKYLRHPSYLRIDGRPVVMILAGYSFVKTLGLEGARAAFSEFDDRCRQAGLDGVYLVFCEGEITSAQAVEDVFAAGVQAFCLYNYPYAGTHITGPTEYGEASYEHLIEQGEGLWQHWRGITKDRFWPTVMPGWDRRPWTKDRDLVRTGSTPDLFARSLRAAKEHANGRGIVMIEAWNEWAEGSILEPCIEFGFSYLDRVREVFCPAAGEHKDVTALSRYELELPSQDIWRFSRDAEGWTKSGTTELEFGRGGLRAVSTTDDPLLRSPATYLSCAAYPRLRLRMRLTPPEGGPTEGTGQVFWSTVSSAIHADNSVTFPVALDGRWHLYDVELGASSHWVGTADRLRIDPVTIEGVRIEVDSVALGR